MAVDGYLNFDTKIKTSAFEAGTAKITANAKSTASNISKTVSQTSSKIQAILDDTERSNKSKAASIVAIYRKEGTEISEAMEKAWSHIERGSAESVQEVSKNAKRIRASLSGLKPLLSKLAVAASAMFSTYALVNFGKQAINMASDLQEVQNVVDVSFGSMSSKMEEFAEKSIETYGISKLTAKRTGSTYMAMAKGMGIAEEAASDMSLTLTGLSADMASFYNEEQSVTATALNSVFTGETETLKKFGIVMTEANLQTFALSRGITKSVSAMSQAEKVQLRYAFVMEQTALAQGDFARTSDGWANQTRILSEQWKEFAGTVGRILMNTFLPAVQSLNKAMTWLNSVAQDLYETLAAIFDWDIKSDPKGVVDDISNAFGDATDEQKALTEATAEYQNQLMGFDKINKLNDNSSSSESAFGSGQGLAGGSNTVPMDIDTSKAEKKLTDFQKKLKEFVGSLKLTFNDVFIDWDDLTGEQIAKKVMTGLTTICGAVAGFTIGGMPGAIVGSLVGCGLGLVFSSISFDGDGNISTDELVGMIVSVLTGAAGAAIGFSIGGVGGAAIGATIGIGISMLINRVDYEKLGDDIGRFFSDLWEKVKNVGKNISTFFSDMWSGVSENAGEAWEGVQKAFGNVSEWFGNVFSKAWQKVKDVFSSGGEVFTGIKDGILNGLKTVINGLISGINRVIAIPFNGINTALSKIKYLSILGSQPFIDKISLINVPQIPHLATGTVVPANYGEFLAVLGDNKREPEIVSPESAIRKIVSEELNKHGGIETINLIAELDGEVVYRKIVKRNKQNTKMTGVNALATA